MDGAGLPEVRSTCAYCGVGCGVLLRPDGAGGLVVRGDPDHPANHGRLCSKGLALGETAGVKHRLLTPRAFGRDTTWDKALQLVADQFLAAIDEHGPDSVAFYVSGQLLTEDYYVANKLMKGFIGSANIDTNSRLCMASTVAGHKRAFGADTVPGTYEDLDQADLIVLVGSNLAWCHPVLYQRIITARQARGTKIVVVDPRKTASCDQADLHLAIKPGSDVALFNRLLYRIHQTERVNEEFLNRSVGYSEAVLMAEHDDPDKTGLSADEIETFCNLWIGTERVVTIYSQGVNQSSSGTDKVNSILNCHLAMGRIGRPGMGPFSVTGQPNAMGGREVGGLANMLACHLDIENQAHRNAVQNYWSSPKIPQKQGLKAVDLFQQVEAGKIKALWVIHTNPAVTMPDANRVKAALKNCPFTVVSDLTEQTDTARIADVLLPAAGWGEKSGTVTNSDRTISRQRAALVPPGQAREDWDILAEVGRRMGWLEAFSYETPAQIFREYSEMTKLAVLFGKDLDVTDFSDISEQDYEAMTPTRWPTSSRSTDGRFFADGRFFHSDGKARFVPVSHRPPEAVLSDQYPFLLNTGRSRDQWHTMTRSGLSPRLSAHLAEPHLEINPIDAERLGLKAADLVKVSSAVGRCIFRVRITNAIAPGQVFAPIHWTGETAPAARVDALIPSMVDPISGQPESKATAVSLQRMSANWYGFAVSVNAARPEAEYWAISRTDNGFRMELAGETVVDDWESTARGWFGLPEAFATSVEDSKSGAFRIALSDGKQVLAALFVSRQPTTLMRDYLATLPDAAAQQILSGRSLGDSEDCGPIVCSCFGVGLKSITRAVHNKHQMSVDDIGDLLQAGTNCGSCRPEIAELIKEHSKTNQKCLQNSSQNK